ncbi:unnamed protein product, partial [Prorocentrum cordatum]
MCMKRGYQWSYKKRQSCFSCGHALRPAPSPPPPPPRGVWSRDRRGDADRGARGEGDWRGGDGDWHERSRQRRGAAAQPLGLSELVESLEGQATSDAQREALQLLEKAFAPPPPTERPALVEEGIQRAAAAERAARRSIEKATKQLADARQWLAECQAKSDAAADELVLAEVKLANEKKALQEKGHIGAINLSALLEADSTDFHVEDGPLFDLEGLEVSSAQLQQCDTPKAKLAASVQEAVRTHFGPGAEALKAQREQLEELKALRATFKKRR